MYIKKIFALFIISISSVLTISAQQRYFISNVYAYDLFLINPAAAALKSDCSAINGYYQKQWLGTELAPTTQMIAFQKAFRSNLGIGNYIYNDRNGNHREFGLQQTFAYEVILEKSQRRLVKMQFGISALLNQRSLSSDFLADADIPDPISSGSYSGYAFNANSGLMLTANDWQVGFSLTNMLPTSNSLYQGESEPPTPMDLNFTMSWAYKVPKRNIYLEPLFFYRRNNYIESRSDLNLKFTLPAVDPSFAWWGNLAYRHELDADYGKSVGAAAALGIYKNGFKFGMEYQFGLTNAQYDYGSSYQLIVGYNFCRDRLKYPIPCSKKTRDKLNAAK